MASIILGIVNMDMVTKMQMYHDSLKAGLIKAGLKTTHYPPEIIQNGQKEKVGSKCFISMEIKKCFQYFTIKPNKEFKNHLLNI